MQAQVRVNGAALAAWCRSVVKNFNGKEYNKLLLDQAKETAEELAKNSLPSPSFRPGMGDGNTPEAFKAGEMNVRRELYQMFRPLESFSVRQLAAARNPAVFEMAEPINWRDPDLRKAWESRNMDIMWNTFAKLHSSVGETDEFEYQEREQGDEGLAKMPYVATPTINAQYSMMRNGQWNGKSRMLVKNRAVLAKFVRERIQSVGKSVNGWVQAAQQLRSSIARVMPGAGEGKATLKAVNGGHEWTLENKYGNPNGMMTATLQRIGNQQTQKFHAKVYDWVKKIVSQRATAAPASSGGGTWGGGGTP